MAEEVKILLRLKKRPLLQPVHFKSDGGKFESERTLKLNTDSKYITEIAISPVQSIEKCEIYGNDQRLLLKQLEDDIVVYKTEWQTTDIKKSKKGTRMKVPFFLRLKNFGELMLYLQCKFYSETEIQHACWGPVCGSIEFICKHSPCTEYVDVQSNILI